MSLIYRGTLQGHQVVEPLWAFPYTGTLQVHQVDVPGILRSHQLL